jgi:hypothetical protein
MLPCICVGRQHDHGVGSFTALLHQSHQPYCQSACLAVAIPLDDIFERGKLTNVLEDRIFFKEENL